MDYPFSHFMRHIEQWPRFSGLTEVVPMPEQSGGEPLPIGDARDPERILLRAMHMLAAEGCTPEARDYRSRRFVLMLQFLAFHREALRKAGLIVIDDGETGAVTHAAYRAIHETFRGQPLKHADVEPIGPIIERAKGYTGQWNYE